MNVPQVVVRYNPSFLNEGELGTLARRLPHFVAEHLSVPGTEAEVKPEEVEVEFRPAGKFDVMQKHRLTVTITANFHPVRDVICKEASEAIAAKISELFFPGSERYIPTGWVWIRLAPGAFSEFPEFP